MALKQVQQIGPAPEVTEKKAKKGWGEAVGGVMGVAGAVAGGMAGAVTGGPAGAVVGATGGASGSYSLGSMLGEKMKPSVQAQKDAIQRQAVAGPQMTSTHSDTLKQAVTALHQAPPDVQEAYADPLIKAYMKVESTKYT
jgi:outer membrane lipoprotein SlyB